MDESIVKCIVCGKKVEPEDDATEFVESIHKDCSKQQFAREGHGKKQ